MQGERKIKYKNKGGKKDRMTERGREISFSNNRNIFKLFFLKQIFKKVNILLSYPDKSLVVNNVGLTVLGT